MNVKRLVCHHITNKVEISFHVLGAWMKKEIGREISCPYVVTPKNSGFGEMNAKFMQQGFKPWNFCSSAGPGNLMSS